MNFNLKLINKVLLLPITNITAQKISHLSMKYNRKEKLWSCLLTKK